MKNYKFYALLMMCFLLTNEIFSQRLNIEFTECNSVLVEIEESMEQSRQRSYALEKLLIADVWSQKEKTSNKKNQVLFSNLKKGIYRITVVDSKNNAASKKGISFSEVFVIDECSDAKTETKSVGIKLPSASIYPNPNTGIFSLLVEDIPKDGELWLGVYNALGAQVYNQSILDERTTIDLTKLEEGVYFLNLTNASGQTLSAQKIILTK